MYGFTETTLKNFISWCYSSSGPSGAHITRFKMYHDLAGSLASEDAPTKTVLSISRSAHLGVLTGLRQAKYLEISYPDNTMCDIRFDDNTFDFCVSDQVLEHVKGDPLTAFKESFRVIKPGGCVCHTTCFVNPIHAAPSDFWRFTPAAVRLMCNQANAEVVSIGSWGNREAWALIEAGFRSLPIPLDPANPLYKIATYNEDDVPIVVWVIARKQATVLHIRTDAG
jgi:SAM-dependent methyltransferase